MKFSIRWTALLLAGSFFFCGCSGGGTVRRDVVISGVEVGGMRYAEAIDAVRRTLAERMLPLVVHTPEGDVSPSLTFRDDLSDLVRRAKRGERLEAALTRQSADAEEVLLRACARAARPAEDATVTFTAEGFSYTAEREGRACDYEALLCRYFEALRTGETEIGMPLTPVAPAVTEEALRARTRPLSSFTTRFDGSDAARAGNIALAAQRIAGTTVEAGEEFSFNGRVGKRTAENGFREAPVISDGAFVQGVGGGVCQASTTLFGAALRAGMRVVESHPHSLAVGYVNPSEDAMVSETSDLRFRNPYPFPVYISATADAASVTFSFFGMPDGLRYEVESRVLFYLDPPPPRVTEGDEDRVVRRAKRGIASESYLVAYDGSEEVRRERIRRDTYAPVQGETEKKRAETPEEVLEGEL